MHPKYMGCIYRNLRQIRWYPLSYVKPRIKGKSFNEEVNTREILAFQQKEMEQFYTRYDVVEKTNGIMFFIYLKR